MTGEEQNSKCIFYFFFCCLFASYQCYNNVNTASIYVSVIVKLQSKSKDLGVYFTFLR